MISAEETWLKVFTRSFRPPSLDRLVATEARPPRMVLALTWCQRVLFSLIPVITNLPRKDWIRGFRSHLTHGTIPEGKRRQLTCGGLVKRSQVSLSRLLKVRQVLPIRTWPQKMLLSI